jgi:hypothetical protein
MPEHNPHNRSRVLRYGAVLVALLLFGAACSRGSSSTASPTAATATTTRAAAATAKPSATATPKPTATATVTPSPTPFVPPTVAVTSDDDVRSCLDRNLTPELLISLSHDDDSLANDIIRTCLETQLPSELVFIMGPIIDTTSQCALDTSKTLSNADLITLAGPDGAAKDTVVNRVTDDIISCTADHYHIPSNIFG